MNEVQQNEILEQFLESLRYPLSKPTLLAEAHEGALAEPLAEALERLPDREYDSKEDLVRELNASQ
jgi:hypothetical protein